MIAMPPSLWSKQATDSSGTETASKQVKITVADAQLSDIEGPCVVCTGSSATFTVEVSPTEFADKVVWSGGGTPASGTGLTFATQWEEAGTKAVTATVCSSTKSFSTEVVACCPSSPDVQATCVRPDICEQLSLDYCTWGMTENGTVSADTIICFDGSTWRVQVAGLTYTVVAWYDTKNLDDCGASATCDAAGQLTWWKTRVEANGVPCMNDPYPPGPPACIPLDCVKRHEEKHRDQACAQFAEDAPATVAALSALTLSPSGDYCAPDSARSYLQSQISDLVEQLRQLEIQRKEWSIVTREQEAYAETVSCLTDMLDQTCSQLQDCPSCQ